MSQEDIDEQNERIFAKGDPMVYVAMLSQTGTAAPVATVVKNEFPGLPVWSRFQAGTYILTLSEGFPFGRTLPDINPNISIGTGGGTVSAAHWELNDGDSITLSVDDGDEVLNGAMVRIEVYPAA